MTTNQGRSNTTAWRSRVLGVGAAVTLGALTPTAAAVADELRVGALMPMTGDLQAYGETSLNGTRLAIDEINEQGGVGGAEVELITGDTQTAPQAGIDAAQQLVNIDGVHGIVGALSSGVTIPVAEGVARGQGVLQISPASTSPVITDLEDDDFLFRTTPSDALQGLGLADLVDEDGKENVSILYINNDYGEGLAESFTEAFEANGGSVLAAEAYDDGAGSYRGELSSVAEDGSEALVLIGYPENGITILRQAVEGGHFDEFVFTDGMRSPSVPESVGADVLDGMYGTAPEAMEDADAAQRFRDAYEDAYGERPAQPFIDTAYDAAFVIALAAEAAGSRDRTEIRDHVREVANAPGETILPGQWSEAVELLAAGEDIHYTGASGDVDFDENGDVGGTFGHWVYDGEDVRTVEVFGIDADED